MTQSRSSTPSLKSPIAIALSSCSCSATILPSGLRQMAVTLRLPQVVRHPRRVRRQLSPRPRVLQPARPRPKLRVLLKHRGRIGPICSGMALFVIVTVSSGVVYGIVGCQHKVFEVVFNLTHCFVILRANGREQEGCLVSSIG